MIYKVYRTAFSEQHSFCENLLHAWFIVSVAFPVMFLGLLDRKSYEDSYYVG